MLEEVWKDTLTETQNLRLYSLMIFKFSFFKPVNNKQKSELADLPISFGWFEDWHLV